MINYFHLLSQPENAHLDLDALTESYTALASEHHPDKGGDELKFNEINTAYQTLKSPSQRLKHLMELAEINYDKRGTVSNHLMNTFMSTGETLQKADTFIKKKQAATSALAKALLEPQTIDIQESISQQIDNIEQQQQQTLANTTSPDHYEISSRDLAFLEKWQAQLKQRYASLF